jgi:peptidoglycan/xylan/chitin deacetylase (PgdA/CDA1 family)
VALVLSAVLVLPAPAGAAADREREHRVTPCSRGLVALTFDDGPSPAVTPHLVRLLRRLGVPATFFMVGDRVAGHPDLARLVHRAGFAIGNHTWAHTDLTTQTGSEIRRALRDTRDAIVEAGVPAPTLARPPYGAVDDRVRRVLARAGYLSVLWTIDSRDWAGGTPHRIAQRVIAGVHRHRVNLVLQHDGVTHSPSSVRAVTAEVTTLRRRGFCFAGLDAAGRPTPPVPRVTVSADERRVQEGGRVRLTVRLDRPTTRATIVRTSAGTVRVAAGRQAAHLRFRARQDATDEVVERVTFVVRPGRGLEPGPQEGALGVVDDDPPPQVRLTPATATSSPLLTTDATIGVRLDRSSDRPVRVEVRSPLGGTSVDVPAGARRAALTLTVPVGRPRDGLREVPVRITRVDHGVPGPATALTVHPPARTAAQATRDAVAAIRWPVVALPALF